MLRDDLICPLIKSIAENMLCPRVPASEVVLYVTLSAVNGRRAAVGPFHMWPRTRAPIQAARRCGLWPVSRH